MKRDNITKNAISEPSPPAYSRAQTVNEDRMALVRRSSRIHDRRKHSDRAVSQSHYEPRQSRSAPVIWDSTPNEPPLIPI